ncbi:response regulator transcription factor [Niabella ginsengisoli]|uniref:Response regulator n=1 Tax=Niabella ginsengisoli TaxID=522298 RepID=A0ABS9SPD8_9BACT|nr:response regulator [Niabella ginsengisoli]MCH5600213.1 response regulator [Niabella ginsengisoli]
MRLESKVTIRLFYYYSFQKNEKICIVEDNPDISFILDYFLREEGFDVIVFATIREFKKGILVELPDLFLLDVMLPDGDGITLCEQLKNDKATSTIPVLIMSAHASFDKVRQTTCANGFINKPFDLNDMLNMITEQLRSA